MAFTCKRCGYASAKKGNVMRHLKGQKDCDPLMCNIPRSTLVDELEKKEQTRPFVCEFCNKDFTSASGKSQHKRKCNFKNTNEIHDLMKTIEDLRNEVVDLKSHKTIIVNNNTNIYNDNRVVIVNQFQKVQTTYIERGQMLDILGKRTFNHLYDSLKEVVRIVYYNEKHPENHSVYIPNIRDRYARIYDGNDWVFKDKTEVITYMRNLGVEIMRDFFYDNQHEFTLAQKQIMKKWDLSYTGENKPFDRKTKEAVVETILSRQKLVKYTIDKYNLL